MKLLTACANIMVLKLRTHCMKINRTCIIDVVKPHIWVKTRKDMDFYHKVFGSRYQGSHILSEYSGYYSNALNYFQKWSSKLFIL